MSCECIFFSATQFCNSQTNIGMGCKSTTLHWSTYTTCTWNNCCKHCSTPSTTNPSVLNLRFCAQLFFLKKIIRVKCLNLNLFENMFIEKKKNSIVSHIFNYFFWKFKLEKFIYLYNLEKVHYCFFFLILQIIFVSILAISAAVPNRNSEYLKINNDYLFWRV